MDVDLAPAGYIRLLTAYDRFTISTGVAGHRIPKSIHPDNLTAFTTLLKSGQLRVYVLNTDGGNLFEIEPEEWRDADQLVTSVSYDEKGTLQEYKSGFIYRILTGGTLDRGGRTFDRYAGRTGLVAVEQLNRIIDARTKLNRQRKYDWIALREALFSELDYRGSPMASDRGWSCQADVERWIAEWFEKAIGSAPTESLVRKHAAALLRDYDVEKANRA